VSAFTVRHRIAIIVVIVAACVGLLALDSQGLLDPIRTGLRQALTPIDRLTEDVIRTGESDSDLARENEALRQERDALAAEVARLQMLETEVEQLREQLQVQQDNPDWTLVTARVSFSDPTNLNKIITIDKGSADGIQKGMAVVDPFYFVGLVTSVSEHSAQITLGIDMTAVIGGEDLYSGASGNVYGMWQLGQRMEMRHIDRNSEIKHGDPIVTASNATYSTAMVPGGIIIGIVDGDPTLDNQGDSQTVNVLPAADFDNLDVVAVIVASDPNEAVPPTPVVQASPVPEATLPEENDE
jgi:rod shape-determining protein MreC